MSGCLLFQTLTVLTHNTYTGININPNVANMGRNLPGNSEHEPQTLNCEANEAENGGRRK